MSPVAGEGDSEGRFSDNKDDDDSDDDASPDAAAAAAAAGGCDCNARENPLAAVVVAVDTPEVARPAVLEGVVEAVAILVMPISSAPVAVFADTADARRFAGGDKFRGRPRVRQVA